MSNEFKFLPDLPKPNLDDRTFQDLVNECLLRIPRYCPEWTNYNPSDPGITLVELFAWLTDQMLLRFNQVPVRNYITFLELLGITLQAPAPAKTEVTFYMTTTSNNIPDEDRTIRAGIEVATERTETEEAIIFATDKPLTIGKPRLKHCLTASNQSEQNIPSDLSDDHFASVFNENPNGEWENTQRGLNIFGEEPHINDCFYLVFNNEPIEGNIISVTIKGEAATTTGINPQRPPRLWEAWNGDEWQPVLVSEIDDNTEGFSFSRFKREGGDSIASGTDIILHLPLDFPITNFESFEGRWLRCRYTTEDASLGYVRSPRLMGMSVRALGGTVEATQCTRIEDEIIGESNGNPEQTFFLKVTPVLPLDISKKEYLEVIPKDSEPQIWTEVKYFSDSTGEDRHYTLEPTTGRIQFGPLIREPAQIKEATSERNRLQQSMSRQMLPGGNITEQGAWRSMQRQAGAVPPKGATLRMVAYRTGGGRRGNIAQGAIRIVKTAVPYVASVTNNKPAVNGTDSESLDAAVLRVPRMLRTRDRAVTAEDFETLARVAAEGAIARSLCLCQEAGTIKLLLVPQANTNGIELGEGIPPSAFKLTDDLKSQISNYLDERKLLGVKVVYEQPEYIGVQVKAQVVLEPKYNNDPRLQQELQTKLKIDLYRLFNPLTGGFDGKGWSFGREVYPSDIVKLLQTTPGVLRVIVHLVEWREVNGIWQSSPKEEIKPSEFGLVCSWRDDQLGTDGSGHHIQFITLNRNS